MEALKVNKFGRTFHPGMALGTEMRALIIDRIVEEGGDRRTGFIPRPFKYFAEELRIHVNTVKSVWRKFCEVYSI